MIQFKALDVDNEYIKGREQNKPMQYKHTFQTILQYMRDQEIKQGIDVSVRNCTLEDFQRYVTGNLSFCDL